MSYTIEPVDPLISPEKDDTYFFADEKMLEILINDDIEEYLNYIRDKRKNNNLKKEQEEIKENERLKKENEKLKKEDEKFVKNDEMKEKNRQLMIREIFASMNRLEDTIKYFAHKK